MSQESPRDEATCLSGWGPSNFLPSNGNLELAAANSVKDRKGLSAYASQCWTDRRVDQDKHLAKSLQSFRQNSLSYETVGSLGSVFTAPKRTWQADNQWEDADAAPSSESVPMDQPIITWFAGLSVFRSVAESSTFSGPNGREPASSSTHHFTTFGFPWLF